MAKTKTKTQLPESKLLKAMAELESIVEKGDELEDQDPEGGLSAEGTPLSNKAPKGKSTKKSRTASSDDESDVEKADDDDDASIEKMMSASDDESEDSPPPFKKKDKKKTKKSFPPAKASKKDDDASSDDESSDDESSDDASSDDDEPAKKSFRSAAEKDETVAKAIEVSDFLEAMVDQISVAFSQMSKSFAKELQAVEARFNARLDNRVSKSISYQTSFNQRLAQGVSAIGNSIQDEVLDVMKSLVNSPAGAPRGKAVLSKGEINQPPWSGNQGGGQAANGSDAEGSAAELSELSPEAIGEWLFKSAATNKIDPKLILAWEADHYNPETLPAQVRKALVNDLCK